MEESEGIQYFKQYPDQIDFVDCEGDSHLHLATKAGDSEVVEFLLNNGVEVNAPNKFGDTPLLMVTPNDERMRKVVSLLIYEGADVTHKNQRGVNALILFRKKFMPRSKKWFGREVCRGLRYLDLSDQQMADLLYEAKWPIRSAVWTRRPTVTKLLIDMGEDINATSEEGLSALTEAASIRDYAHVALLLSRGANLHQKSNRWGNALSISVMSGIKGSSNLKVMSLLMENGLDPNELIKHEDYDAESPFQLALLYGNEKTVKLMVNHGGDLNFIDLKGRTAVHLVACNPHVDVMKMLESSKTIINWDVRNFNGQNALHLAAWSGNSEVAKILYKNGTSVDGESDMGVTPLMYALISYTSPHYWKGAHHATIKKNLIIMIELLLSYGAKVDAVTPEGHTPLSIAYPKIRVASIIIRRIAQNEMFGIPISPKNMELINSKYELRNYYHRCKEELRRMEFCVVHSGINMLNILNVGAWEFSSWTRNDDASRTFAQKIAEFSNYREILEKKFCDTLHGAAAS